MTRRDARHLGWLLLAGVCAVGTPALAYAQDTVEQAAVLDHRARAAFEQGDYETAAKDFAAAQQIAPHPATRYNEAMAWDRAGKLARAADAYRKAMEADGLDEARMDASRERLHALRARLALLEVREPKGGRVSVAHAHDIPIPCEIFLLPGSQPVLIHGPDGRSVQRTVEAQAGQTLELVIDVEAPKPTAPPSAQRPTPVPERPVDQGNSTATWGWIALGTATTASGAAVYLGVRTLQSRDDFEASDRLSEDDRNRALKYRTWTNLAWGTAALTASAGVVLLLSGGEDTPEGQTTATVVRLTPMGAEASWTF